MIGDWREWEPELPEWDYPGHTLKASMASSKVAFDTFSACDSGCHHDTARAVTLDPLLDSDGPYPDQYAPLAVGRRMIDGLHRAMPDMSRAQTSPAS